MALMSPTDERFLVATESTDQLYPISASDREAFIAEKKRADELYEAGDRRGAQLLWDAAEATNIRNEKINSEYGAVVKCAIDAKTCANYWLKYAPKKDYEYAGQWHDLLHLLNLRLVDHRKAEEDAVAAEKEARKAKRARTVRNTGTDKQI